MFPQPGVPPFGPGLLPARTAAERALHDEVAANTRRLFDTGLPALNAARRALGLAPLQHVLDQAACATVHLLATARAFDFCGAPPPSQVRYVGPQITDPAWSGRWRSPWARDDARPLVLVSFSTTYQNHVGVLQRVIDAMADLPLRVLVTLGHGVHAQELQPPANCVLLAGAPHSQVMRAAALVVTHGGHGTVMAALSHRLPMLLLPLGRDQADNAVRVTARGAGLTLPGSARQAEIRAAVTQLLARPDFKTAALQLGDAVAAAAEQSSVIEELERAALHAGPPQRALNVG